MESKTILSTKSFVLKGTIEEIIRQLNLITGSNLSKKDKQVSPSIKAAKSLIDFAYDSTDLDELFNLADELAALRIAIRDNPEELCEMIKTFEGKIQHQLDELDICPECGAHLEWEHDKRYDTYVPWGSTSVLESEGGAMKCPSCGYTKE